jgi:prenylcysteine oxidase/farnesylcysteine lyase
MYTGSTIVHPHNNKSLPGLELGAAVFVPLNKNLWRAADDFNLTRRDLDSLDNYETGIWDGREVFVSVRNVLILVPSGILYCLF